MFIRTISKSNLQKTATALLFAAAAAVLLYRPAAMATGISRGLAICCTVIIPTPPCAGTRGDSPAWSPGGFLVCPVVAGRQFCSALLAAIPPAPWPYVN